MNLTDFVTYLVSNLVKNPDLVKVSSFESEEEGTIVEILVANADMGAVIGKLGSNAKALRTVIQAYAYKNNMGRIKVNIDAF